MTPILIGVFVGLAFAHALSRPRLTPADPDAALAYSRLSSGRHRVMIAALLVGMLLFWTQVVAIKTYEDHDLTRLRHPCSEAGTENWTCWKLQPDGSWKREQS